MLQKMIFGNDTCTFGDDLLLNMICYFCRVTCLWEGHLFPLGNDMFSSPFGNSKFLFGHVMLLFSVGLHWLGGSLFVIGCIFQSLGFGFSAAVV